MPGSSISPGSGVRGTAARVESVGGPVEAAARVESAGGATETVARVEPAVEATTVVESAGTVVEATAGVESAGMLGGSLVGRSGSWWPRLRNPASPLGTSFFAFLFLSFLASPAFMPSVGSGVFAASDSAFWFAKVESSGVEFALSPAGLATFSADPAATAASVPLSELLRRGPRGVVLVPEAEGLKSA